MKEKARNDPWPAFLTRLPPSRRPIKYLYAFPGASYNFHVFDQENVPKCSRNIIRINFGTPTVTSNSTVVINWVKLGENKLVNYSWVT